MDGQTPHERFTGSRGLHHHSSGVHPGGRRMTFPGLCTAIVHPIREALCNITYQHMATLDEARNRIKMAYAELGSWRKVAAQPEYAGLSHATLSAIARGRDPVNSRTRQQLGLPPVSTVISVDGVVAPGAQTIGSLECVKCGRPFIPNTPRRVNCFICNPFKGKHARIS